MAEIFGIDFGTTSSLVTYIGADGRPHSALDLERRPHPSVIWFHGDRVIVGREARQHLDAGRDAVAGDFIRSPKRLLYRGEGNHAIPGRVVDRRDAVSYVLEFLKGDLTGHDPHAPPFEHAVFTIPVTFDGNARRDFREAARRAGLNVVYFIHEPLAALYAYLRDRPDSARLMAELDGKFILVFDWGGGTLDLTLCQVRGNALYQIINDGNDEAGGDRFDESLRNLVPKNMRISTGWRMCGALNTRPRACALSIAASAPKSPCPRKIPPTSLSATFWLPRARRPT